MWQLQQSILQVTLLWHLAVVAQEQMACFSLQSAVNHTNIYQDGANILHPTYP